MGGEGENGRSAPQLPTDPIAVAGFGADRVMADTQHLADLVYQLELRVGDNEFQPRLERMWGWVGWIEVHCLTFVASWIRVLHDV